MNQIESKWVEDNPDRYGGTRCGSVTVRNREEAGSIAADIIINLRFPFDMELATEVMGLCNEESRRKFQRQVNQLRLVPSED